MREKRPETRYEFKLNFKEITLFIVGSVGVISLFFIIGIWIGKSLNAVPNEMLNDEYLTERDFPRGEDADDEKEVNVTKKDDTSYEFQGTLKGNGIIPMKDDGKIKIVKDKKPDAKKAKRAKQAKKAIDNFKVSKEAPKAKQKVVVAKAKKEPPKPKKRGKYTVQLASLKDDKSALKLVGRLEKKGYEAYFVATNLKDKGVWYRVRVGNYQSKGDASKVIKKLEKAMKMKGMVVRDSRN